MFCLNEYWILVPSILFLDYLIIRKIKSHKRKMDELKKLKKMIEHYKKRQKFNKLIYLGCALSVTSTLLLRGGDDLIDVESIECGIEAGLRYLDNDRIRKIIHNLYSYKRKNKIIYITATAACHLVKIYGKRFLALPIAVGDFGTTNLYQSARKAVVTILLGAIGPLYMVGGAFAITLAVGIGTYALKLAFTDLDSLPTSAISPTTLAKKLKPRISDLPDVITVNFRDRIKAPDIEKGFECVLPEQKLFNPSCNLPIPTKIATVAHDLTYDDVVNMKDGTGLEPVNFNDVFDLGKPNIPNSRRSKMVNFLDMFKDPETISESETWDASTITDRVAKKMNLRAKN